MRRPEPYHGWWHEVVSLRVSPQRLSWMLLAAGLATCVLTSGCGGTHARSNQSPPDLVVTTLDERDLADAIALLQLQRTIHLGIHASRHHELPASSVALLDEIEERWRSRDRDLRALMQVKNVPDPAELPDHHRVLLSQVASVSGDSQEEILRFHESTHRELMRLLRMVGDGAADQDLRDFALRNRPAAVSTLDLLARSGDAR